jgi:hypothetical protein
MFQVSEPTKESVWIMETEPHGRSVTIKPGTDNQNNEVYFILGIVQFFLVDNSQQCQDIGRHGV